MLSYRHGFHAGNPADVFKHTTLLCLIRAMQDKPAGISFMDTHSGAARYDLTSEWALKTREFEPGIARLWKAGSGGSALCDYLDQVRRLNPDDQLRYYPGSPLLIANLLRPVDQLTLCELHPAEQQRLEQEFSRQPRVRLVKGDGYQALSSCAPPKSGRGLVLIDPSYEMRDELQTMGQALEHALKRFAHGVYVVWYPMIEGRDIAIAELAERLKLDPDRWLDLRIEFPDDQRLGRMWGCGMAMINPPWRARKSLIELAENDFSGRAHHL